MNPPNYYIQKFKYQLSRLTNFSHPTIEIHQPTETVSCFNDVVSEISIRPSGKQYIPILYDFVWRFLPIVGLLLLFYYKDMPLAFVFACLPLLFLLPKTLYRILSLLTSRWVIGEEVITQKLGALSASTLYFELRRVTHYAECQTWMQRLLKIKTVHVTCSDMGDMQIAITGVPSDFPLLPIIRQHAELCKARKGYTEFTYL